MALLAKNSGMVMSWPTPMKRSRDFTRQAMMKENVAKMAEPSMAPRKTPRIEKQLPANLDAHHESEQINDGGLHRAAKSRGGGLAVDQRGALRRADQKLVHDAQIAFPDDGDAVEDGDEENALRQDARRHEGEIADVAGGNAAHAAEHLPKITIHRTGCTARARTSVGSRRSFFSSISAMAAVCWKKAKTADGWAQPRRLAVRRVARTSR